MEPARFCNGVRSLASESGVWRSTRRRQILESANHSLGESTLWKTFLLEIGEPGGERYLCLIGLPGSYHPILSCKIAQTFGYFCAYKETTAGASRAGDLTDLPRVGNRGRRARVWSYLEGVDEGKN
jgi:hypothetical protein